MPELDSTVHDRCLFAAQVSFNLAVDEYHLVWLPTGEWLYVRLEVGALSVNALWALRAGRWGWRCGPVGLGWGAIVLGITFLALLRQVALEPCS